MKANELRIGNRVNMPFLGCLELEVIGLAVKDDFQLYIQSKSFENTFFEKPEKYRPIPLTEEWHNKFGVFKNGFESFEYVLPRKNNISLKVIFTGDYVMLKQGKGTPQDDIVSIWNKDITKRDMFVHEWQNLYFALTGEELTLNP